MTRIADRAPSALHDIPVFDAAEVEARLAGADLKAILASAFAGLADGQAVQPPQTLALLPRNAGDFILYSAALGAPPIFGVKISPYLTQLARAGEVPVTAYSILFSSETGRPLALCDSLALTTRRTAATTSLALDHLAPQRHGRLAVIGAGPVAQAHIAFERASRPWGEVAVFSPRLAADGARRAALQAACPGITVASGAQEAVADADVVMLCTSSATPVLDTAWLKDEVTVTSISTNAARAHEIDPAALAVFQVFCDYRATAPLQAGEMVIAREAHGWDPATIVADLPELVSGRAPALAPGRRFFRSIGLGLEDVAAAAAVLGAR
jgi:L-arginine dehydrogenase